MCQTWFHYDKHSDMIFLLVLSTLVARGHSWWSWSWRSRSWSSRIWSSRSWSSKSWSSKSWSSRRWSSRSWCSRIWSISRPPIRPSSDWVYRRMYFSWYTGSFRDVGSRNGGWRRGVNCSCRGCSYTSECRSYTSECRHWWSRGDHLRGELAPQRDQQ